MRRHAALLALALLAVLGAGCGRRDRANPFDPSNPTTGGRPSGFNAVAGFSFVRLTWSAPSSAAFEGFQLFRLASGDSVYRPLGGSLPPTTLSYTDGGTLNHVRYDYRLYYQREGQTTGAPAEDRATPGGLRPWIVDAGAGQVVRLSPDGRDVIARFGGFESPFSLDVDPLTGEVWVSDTFAGEVLVLDPDVGVRLTIPGIAEPFTIAIDRGTRAAWICDLSGSLHHYAPTGIPATPGRIDLLDSPGGVAVNNADRSLWVCERDGNRVRRYSFDGVPLATGFVLSPSRVAVDSVRGIAWVTSLDRGLVVRVLETGARLDSFAVALGPIGVAVDVPRGLAWIADAVGDAVIAVQLSDGAEVRRVGGLLEPREVAVDPLNGDVWVAARLSGQIVRLSSAGVVLERLGGFDSPYEVRLDPEGP